MALKLKRISQYMDIITIGGSDGWRRQSATAASLLDNEPAGQSWTSRVHTMAALGLIPKLNN